MSSGKDSKVARGATLFNKSKADKDPDTEKALARVRKRIDKLKEEGNPLEYETTLQDENYFPKISSFLTRQGIEVTQYKDKYVLRRVRVRMGRVKLRSFKDYLHYLESHPQEVTELKESLSINVTRFYRNRDTFDLIRDKIFPELMHATKVGGRNEIAVWSAGCAVGAEPYTLAMTAIDSVGSQVKVRIHATDIKNELLAIARNAKYNDQYVAEMTDAEISKFFNKYSEYEYEVIPSVRRLVNFSQHDLMRDPYPKNFDMVICRNVLIYVDREAQVEIVKKFVDSLRPGGILCLGRTETLFGDWRGSMKIISTKHRIYQKMTQSAGNLMEKVPPEMDREKSRRPSKFSKVTKTTSTTTLDGNNDTKQISERMEELKNFRQTYEERRKQWEERMAKYKESSEIEANKTKSRTFTGNNNFRQQIREKNSRIGTTTRKITEESDKETRFSEGGTLSHLRSSLKKTKAEIDSTIKLSKEALEIKSTDTPEEIYRKLQAKKKLREKRFGN